MVSETPRHTTMFDCTFPFGGRGLAKHPPHNEVYSRFPLGARLTKHHVIPRGLFVYPPRGAQVSETSPHTTRFTYPSPSGVREGVAAKQSGEWAGCWGLEQEWKVFFIIVMCSHIFGHRTMRQTSSLRLSSAEFQRKFCPLFLPSVGAW